MKNNISYKRKPFFIKGNFELKVILGIFAVWTASVIITSLCIYERSRIILEKTAFSSHLKVSSSGGLIIKEILSTNIGMALICVLIGGGFIFITHFCLERFFSALSGALKGWRAGQNPCVKKTFRCQWLGKDVLAQCDAILEKRSKKIERIRQHIRGIKSAGGKSDLRLQAQTLEALYDELAQQTQKF